MTDTINPGVRKLVALLNEADFITVDSGDGRTHDHACDRTDAYVVIQVRDLAQLVAAADRVRLLLEGWGVQLSAVGEAEEPCVQASYDPADGSAFIDIRHVTDNMLRPQRGQVTVVGEYV